MIGKNRELVSFISGTNNGENGGINCKRSFCERKEQSVSYIRSRLREREREMEIEHFSHEHPLILREDWEDDWEDDGEAVRCAGCDLAGGPNYSCVECNYFLHKSCAELPRYATHLMHHKHPLTLLSRPPIGCGKCDACHCPFVGFVYNCSRCGFIIDLKCISLPLTIQYESHEHPFTLLPKSAIFCCDACGNTSEGISYLCTTCFLWVHLKCAALPLSLNNIHHQHPLYLTRYLQMSNANNCKICDVEMNLDYWCYNCEGCNFIADVGCATSEIEPIRDVTSSSVKENEHLITKISLEDERVATELECYYIHQHRLNLCEMVPKDEKCDGCTQPILDPYYNCHQCKFSLHVSCSKLPTQLQHPLHPEHQLTLLLKSPYFDGIFRCEACTNLCNGFTYSCDECKFNLDVACSSIADTLKHDGHEHPLFLGQETSCERCSACGEDCVGFSYGCGDCNFKLDTNCATLPGKAKHWFHRHTLYLTFSTIKDDSDEYLCDACEEPRNPNYWFYYCAECDLSAHLSCMRGEYPYIKFGGTYKYDSHPHHLTLVQKTKDNPPCNTCDYPCESLSFECTKCKFNIHWMCQNFPKGALNEDPKLIDMMYLLDKAVCMMMHDAKEICRKKKDQQISNISPMTIS